MELDLGDLLSTSLLEYCGCDTEEDERTIRTASFVSMIIHRVHNNNQQSLVGSLLTTVTVKTELQSTYILELSCIHQKGWNLSRCSTHH